MLLVKMLGAIKIAVNLKAETKQRPMQKAAQHSSVDRKTALQTAIHKALHKLRALSICLKQRVIRPCHNLLYFRQKARIMATAIVAATLTTAAQAIARVAEVDN